MQSHVLAPGPWLLGNCCTFLGKYYLLTVLGGSECNVLDYLCVFVFVVVFVFY